MLSPRKKRQIKRFFRNPKKVSRLTDRLYEKRLGGAVLPVNIAGKQRVVKIEQQQALAKGNLKLLRSAHEEAVKSGIISPKTYSLSTVQYDYVDRRVGIMEPVQGHGFDSLILALHFMKGEKKYEPLARTSQSMAFLKKNPEITEKKLMAMLLELDENLHKISKKLSWFSFDLCGTNNIFVTNYDKATGVFDIMLVDQIYPTQEELVKLVLKHKAQNK